MRDKISDKDTRIVYGISCSWWDSIYKAGSTKPLDMIINGRPVKGISIPCCPYCGSSLMEVPDLKSWYKGVDEFDKLNPGYRNFIDWSRGKCFNKSLRDALYIYTKETGKSVENWIPKK